MPLLALMLLSSTDDQQAAAAAGLGIGLFLVISIFVLAAIVFQVYCYWRVAVKSGYEGALSLLTLIPVVNLVILLIWVFQEWPIETELKRYRAAYGALPPASPPTTAVTPTT
jgi:hypothetical protein